MDFSEGFNSEAGEKLGINQSVSERAASIRDKANESVEGFYDQDGKILDKDAATDIAQAGEDRRNPEGLQKIEDGMDNISSAIITGQSKKESIETRSSLAELNKEYDILQSKILETIMKLPVKKTELDDITNCLMEDAKRVAAGEVPQKQGRIRRIIEITISRAIYEDESASQAVSSNETNLRKTLQEPYIKELRSLRDELRYIKTPDKEDSQ
ncbi:MAG: hypothetical protein WCP14_04600 [bacterium]